METYIAFPDIFITNLPPSLLVLEIFIKTDLMSLQLVWSRQYIGWWDIIFIPQIFFKGLPRAINKLIIYPIIWGELKVPERNPHVIILLQGNAAQDLREVLLSSMRGTGTPSGGILDMEIVTGSDLACHVEVKLACNSWTARFSIKFLIFS